MSLETVINAIVAGFYASITAPEAIPTVFDNAPPDETVSPLLQQPTDGTEWLAFSIKPGESAQADMGSSNPRFRTPGNIYVNIMTPFGDGTARGYEIAQAIISYYRSRPIEGVTFRAPSVVNAEKAGDMWQTVVTCPYYADDFA